ncbi:alpha/beta-hydrolase [Westerdykella ornata]|uniref:Alpha/beta-hydrolase n=1 Tax=Westerdykella ornata TaxID=318751 RepID=A0A6A6JXM8_WESOR|nr:alpha/beta-hydrolase [Westerdykella ornata]KAF2280975.1 alpha/beta-hydrolase [Westerdykella ornata]
MAISFGLLLFLLQSIFSFLSHGSRPLPQTQAQTPLSTASNNRKNDTAISPELYEELEELARIVDIAYCVGTAGLGIQKPFKCASRCSEFENFELVATWNTGPLLSDSCGYIALSHPPSAPRIILAFRGTYSIANTIVDLSTVPQAYVPYPAPDETPPPARPPKCTNCTVHTGFYISWLNTRKAILPDLTAAIAAYPNYTLTLVGHSLGGAVAALAGLDFIARGWDPHVTTFGEPRIGNRHLNAYLNERFGIVTGNNSAPDGSKDEMMKKRKKNKFHRVTHVNDPVPLLPLEEWGYTMHSEELFISSVSDLPPSREDVHHCDGGDEDPRCIAGNGNGEVDKGGWSGVPARFRFWQLFFAHRDYFWRLGLCVPSGGWKGWGSLVSTCPLITSFLLW